MNTGHDDLQRLVELARRVCDYNSASSLVGYLRSVVIDSRPEPLGFAEVAYPWQWSRFDYLTGPLESVAGLRRDYAGPTGIYETAPRGYDKTSGVARVVNWLLAYSRRPVVIVAAAGDLEQATLLREAMQRELRLNPWLADKVTVRQRQAEGPGGLLKIMTADAQTSFGEIPDLTICDELTHWPKGDLWQTLVSGWVKRPNAVLWVITNAGRLRSWQHKALLEALASPGKWVVHEASPSETWMRSEDIQAASRLLPPGEAKRVFGNQWIDPAEDSGYLTRAEILSCEELGRERGLVYQLQGQPRHEHVASLDYGPKRDRTVLTVGHQEADGLVVVDRMDVWQGSPEVPVQIASIREWIESARRNYPALRLVADPYQLEELVQHYERHLPAERFEARGGIRNYEMAELLRTLIVNRRITWYPGCGSLVVGGAIETLVDELAALIIKRMPYGYRFDHELNEHDDRAVSLGMLAVHLLSRPLPSTFGEAAPVPLKQTPPAVFKLRQYTPRPLWGMEEDRRRRP